jgi:hypothetical protein
MGYSVGSEELEYTTCPAEQLTCEPASGAQTKPPLVPRLPPVDVPPDVPADVPPEATAAVVPPALEPLPVGPCSVEPPPDDDAPAELPLPPDDVPAVEDPPEAWPAFAPVVPAVLGSWQVPATHLRGDGQLGGPLAGQPRPI